MITNELYKVYSMASNKQSEAYLSIKKTIYIKLMEKVKRNYYDKMLLNQVIFSYYCWLHFFIIIYLLFEIFVQWQAKKIVEKPQQTKLAFCCTNGVITTAFILFFVRNFLIRWFLRRTNRTSSCVTDNYSRYLMAMTGMRLRC